MTTLSGRTAIITGGGERIGRGIAVAMAREGAAVVVCGRALSALVETCTLVSAAVGAKGARTLPVVCDIGDAEQLAALVNRTVRAFGGVDILINNSTEITRGSLLEVTESEVEAGWRRGPLAAWRLMRLCHPHLKGGGVIVNVSSGPALTPDASRRVMYAADRAALNAISRGAASEWGPDGIRVNVILSSADTPAGGGRPGDGRPQAGGQMVGRGPVTRIGEPQTDIAPAVVFLCGPGAQYLTGARLAVDGGGVHVR